MLGHDPIDRTCFALVVAFTVALVANPVMGAGPEPGSGKTASPSVILAVECKAPCPRVVGSLDDFRSFGLRVSETRLDLLDRVTTEAGVAFAVNHHQYATAGPLTSRLRDFAFLGGSSAGVEGGLGGDWAFGWRAPFDADQGVFARLGVRGQLLGNGVFYGSSLELPVGQAGYQLLRDRGLLVEIALSGAPMLIGRYNVDGAAPRRLGGSFDPGGHLSLRLDAVHLEASYVRALPGDGSRFGALDWLTMELCGAAWPIAACFDARYLSGDVPRSDGSEIVRAETWYLGAHFGLSTEVQPVARERAPADKLR